MSVIWNQIVESYLNIKTCLCSSSISPATFHEMKTSFSGIINSKRRLSTIGNFNDLFSLLEKRLCLSPSNTEILGEMCILLNDERLFKMFENHQRLLMKSRQQNPGEEYALSMFTDSLINMRDLLLNDDFCKELPKEVVDVICNNIRRGWIDLARRLKIKEGDIDSLVEKDLPVHEKVKQVLSMYKMQVKAEDHPRLLLEALAKIHRNDIKEQVNNILRKSAVPYL